MKNFIIHLPKIAESLRTATDLKKQLESFGMDAELFEGTYGNDAVAIMEAEQRTMHPWGIKGPDFGPPPPNHKSIEKVKKPGVKGCFYSHYNLWKKCVELGEPILIWEDDIVVVRPFYPVEWKDILVVALGHKAKSAQYIHYFSDPSGDPKAESFHRTSMPGCCGYAVKPHAAQKLLDVYSTTYLPADNAINQYHVSIQVHNYIMGKALMEDDGKKSLTTSAKFWDSFKHES